MSRYLTPAKIALLVLVRLYWSPRFPIAATIRVLSFISATLIPTSSFSKEGGPYSNVHNFKEELQGADTVWELFNSELCSLTCLDDLFVLWDELPNLFDQKPGDRDGRLQDLPLEPGARGSYSSLSRSSLIGAFVRRAILEFERLQFHDVMQLWDGFEVFQKPLLDSLSVLETAEWDRDADRKGYPTKTLLSMIRQTLHADSQSPDATSLADIERLLDFQIQKMQKYGTRLPPGSQAPLRALLGSALATGSGLSHYVSFLNGWYSGDYRSAFEYLHRYYDYALNSKDGSNYQYALLNTAILQADFGCYSEAIVAMQEAITSARENKDTACLNYCLSWLYHFRSTNPGMQGLKGEQSFLALGSETEGLNYIKLKAREGGMWNIWSSALLIEARHCLTNGQRPLEAFERIYESSDLNNRYDLYSMKSSQCLVLSAVFGRLGLYTLASSYCELVSECYSPDTGMDSLLSSHCRKAYLCMLEGRVDLATAALEAIDPERSRNFKLNAVKAQYGWFIELRQALHSNDMLSSRRLLPMLRSSVSDRDMRFEVALLEIEYLQRLHDQKTAFDRLNELFGQTSAKERDVYQSIRLMTYKSFLFQSCGRPQKGLSISVRAATAALQAKNMYALWHALGAVASILISMGEYQAAKNILDASVYQAAECGDLTMMQTLQNMLAEAYLGLSFGSIDGLLSDPGNVWTALQWVDAAHKSSQSLRDREGQRNGILQAIVLLHMLGEPGKAAEREVDLRQMQGIGPHLKNNV